MHVNNVPKSKDYKFPCKWQKCDKICNRKDHLEKHVLIHTEKKSSQCDICGRDFTTKSNLTRHKKTHSEKPFKCYICSIGFNKETDLKKHIQKHTDDKPFKCDHCGIGFNKKNHLEDHQLIHTGEKSSQCDICGKNFTTKSNLTRHKKTHFEKSLQCTQCHYNNLFKNQDSLRVHIKKFHPTSLLPAAACAAITISPEGNNDEN